MTTTSAERPFGVRDTPLPDVSELDKAEDRAAVDAIVATLVYHLRKEHPRPSPEQPARRDAHPKHHGCVPATFEVGLKGLEGLLAQGLFARPGKYQAWVRFSNAFKVRNDLDRDARGMAIKVMGVPGGASRRHPGLSARHPPLVFRANAGRLRRFPRSRRRGRPVGGPHRQDLRVFLRMAPLQVSAPRIHRVDAVDELLHEPARADLLQPNAVCVRPVAGEVPGAAPTALAAASVGVALDQGVRPQRDHSDPAARAHGSSVNSFRLSASNHGGRRTTCRRPSCPRCELVRPSSISRCSSARTACRSMMRSSPGASGSPAFKTVATITIGPPTVSLDTMMAFGQHLSYTPWHHVPAHRPLGKHQQRPASGVRRHFVTSSRPQSRDAPGASSRGISSRLPARDRVASPRNARVRYP